jgi:hypothetical protein
LSSVPTICRSHDKQSGSARQKSKLGSGGNCVQFVPHDVEHQHRADKVDADKEGFRQQPCNVRQKRSRRWVETDWNFAFKVVPIALTVAMITTEMPAAISPCSIAVAPDSSLINAETFDIDVLPLVIEVHVSALPKKV